MTMTAMLMRTACLAAVTALLPARSPQTRVPGGVAHAVIQPQRAHAGEAVEVKLVSALALTTATATSAELGWTNVPLGHHTRGTSNVMGALPLIPAATARGTYVVHVTAEDDRGHPLLADGTITVE